MRKSLIVCSLLALFSSLLQAQLTILVNAIPANTPAGASIYLAGTVNNWDPGNSAYILTATGTGQYKIVLNIAAGQIKFKFTRGAWASVEGDANGNFLPDRVYTYSGQTSTLNLSILSWEDIGGTGSPNSTAAPNVQILDEDFYMPQLNRFRRVWLYLPPDYASSNKHYPVLYMQDGQNLFDNETSFAGEWKVDETLNTLFQQGDYGCIVVGIDNGGSERLNEYSPWVNPQYGGGQGEQYVEFVANTLKPYIDQHYRTLPNRLTTGIMGSSVGALISMYAFSEHQEVFSRAGIFSPAFWFAGSNSANHTAAHVREGDARVYFLAGGQEPQYVTDDMQAVANAMTTAGFSAGEKRFILKSDGEHSEWFWAREFGDAYKWLFSNTVSTRTPQEQTLSIFPNPTNGHIQISGLEGGNDSISLQIFGADNRLCKNISFYAAEPLDVTELPKGVYWLKAVDASGQQHIARFLRL